MNRINNNQGLVGNTALVLVFISIFAYTPLLGDPTQNIRFFLGALFCLVTFLLLWTQEVRIGFITVSFFVFILFLASTLSFSDFFATSFSELIRWFTLFLIFLASKILWPKIRVIHGFYFVLASINLLSLTTLLGGIFDSAAPTFEVYLAGIQGNKNMNAQLFTLVSLASLSLFFDKKVLSALQRKLSLVMFFIGACFVFICASKSALLLMLIVTSYYLFENVFKDKLSRLIRLTLTVSILLLPFILPFFYFGLNGNYVGAKDRLILWDKAMQMLADRPIFGHGLGSFKILHPFYGDNSIFLQTGDVIYVRVHNDFLQLLAETGIAGFLMFSLLIGMVMKGIWTVRNQSNSRQDSTFVFLALYSILVFSLFSFPLERYATAVIFTLVISWVAYKTELHQNSFSLPIRKISFLILPLSLGLVIVWGSILTSEGIDYKFSKNQRNLSMSKINLAVEKSNTAFYSLNHLATPIELFAGNKLLNKDPKQALNYFEQGLQKAPYHLSLNLYAIKAHQKLKTPEKAQPYVHFLMNRFPHFEQGLVASSNNYLFLDQLDSALFVLEKSESVSLKYSGQRWNLIKNLFYYKKNILLRQDTFINYNGF